jgi:hypothetical protein
MPRLLVYPRETVVAEKLNAIVQLGTANSRMKDFYDLFVLPARTGAGEAACPDGQDWSQWDGCVRGDQLVLVELSVASPGPGIAVGPSAPGPQPGSPPSRAPAGVVVVASTPTRMTCAEDDGGEDDRSHRHQHLYVGGWDDEGVTLEAWMTRLRSGIRQRACAWSATTPTSAPR